MNSHRLLLASLFLTGLVGCSSEPVVLNESELGMVIRYNPDSVSTAEAAAAAQKVCAKYGRKAVFKSSGYTADMFATYACVR